MYTCVVMCMVALNIAVVEIFLCYINPQYIIERVLINCPKFFSTFYQNFFER